MYRFSLYRENGFSLCSLTLLFRAGASSVSELSIVETSDFYSSQCCGGSSNEERKSNSRQKGSSVEGTELMLNSVLF
jgi:hypothetical protein